MRLRDLLPALLWAALIIAGSSVGNPPARPAAEWPSYFAHFGEFFVLGLLTARAAGGRLFAGPRLLVFSLAAGAGALFGLLDEVYQSFVPGRDASVLDWAFDAAGAVCGAATWAARWFRPRSGLASGRPSAAGPPDVG